MIIKGLRVVALQDGKVDFSRVQFLQKFLGICHSDRDIGAFMLCKKGGQRPCNHKIAYRQRSAEPQRLFLIGDERQLLLQVDLVIVEGCKGTLQQPSCVRQDQFFADEAKKPDAIIVLHILDVLRYGRLGDIKLRV